MKKHFFYIAMAIACTMGMAACDSDDDDNNEARPVTLTIPAGAADAVNYELGHPLEPTDDVSIQQLKSLDFTESGQVVVELVDKGTGKLTYVADNATKSGNKYSMSGSKVKGTVEVVNKVATSRATSSEQLEINITVSIENGSVVFQTGDEGATASATSLAVGDATLDLLCRTWKVGGAILDLKSKSKNIKAYEEFTSDANGYFDLRQVREEAENQDLGLSEQEKEDFERTVKDVIITKSGKFIIEYTDHAPDVAEWRWTNAEKTSFSIVLNGEDMGNKFISDGSRITFAFSDNRCNLKLSTNLNDNSNNDWEVMLTLQLRG